MLSAASPLHYPLSAIAAQPQLVLALSLLAVSPTIGGLLIRGDRGAAKSTAARGLAQVLPDTPFVNLPLGATEDRVIGTLDLQAALHGEARLQPGLMAQADGGVLYIDEVNLLPDHLVDVLLDAAAMGTVRVQRDSLSAQAPARFALVGSMNPEEGSLRPQFLDRFGLCVDVLAPLDPTQRREILRRRMAFEQDPQAFWQEWQPQQNALRERLLLARQRLPSVVVTEEALDCIAEQVSSAKVRSLRADLVLYRAARAHAALLGQEQAGASDVLSVARLVLLHRLEDGQTLPPPPEMQSQTQANPTDADQNPAPQLPSIPPPTIQPPSLPPPPELPAPAEPDNDSSPESQGSPELQGSANNHPAQETLVLAPVSAHLSLRPHQGGQPTQRAQSQGKVRSQPSGAPVRSLPDPQAPRLHVPDTLRAAVTRQGLTTHQGPSTVPTPIRLQPQDYRAPVYAPPRGTHTLFVVDSSGSLGVSGQMGLVKGAMLSTLGQAAARDRLALLVFRGAGAELVLDWTREQTAIEQAIRRVPTGGRTPLAHGLRLAAQHLEGVQGGALVLFTDGRANVPLSPGADAWADALEAAQLLKDYPAQVIDTETGHVRLGRAAVLAQIMGATLLSLSHLSGQEG